MDDFRLTSAEHARGLGRNQSKDGVPWQLVLDRFDESVGRVNTGWNLTPTSRSSRLHRRAAGRRFALSAQQPTTEDQYSPFSPPGCRHLGAGSRAAVRRSDARALQSDCGNEHSDPVVHGQRYVHLVEGRRLHDGPSGAAARRPLGPQALINQAARLSIPSPADLARLPAGIGRRPTCRSVRPARTQMPRF